MKVAVVGGGSTYTPELIEGLAVRDDRVRIDDLVLLDIDPDRAEIVGGMARRQLARLGWAGRLQISGVLEASLEGADFVIVQLRVGGQAARFVDETLPPRFGTIGQETTGAGGFAKALRTVPVVLDIAQKADRLAAPGHWIVDFTNPVGIVSQALLDDGHRAIGLCNVAIGFQRRFAARFGVEPERVELEHVGLNHLTWIRAVRVDGVDRLPELLDEDGDAIAEDVGVPPGVRAVAAGRSPPTTSATTTCSRRSSPISAETATRRGPRRSRRSSASCSRCTATRRSTRSRRSSPTAAGRSTARRPPS